MPHVAGRAIIEPRSVFQRVKFGTNLPLGSMHSSPNLENAVNDEQGTDL